MVVYFGVVRDGRVMFEGDVPLPEGTLVEVRPRQHDAEQEARLETLVQERLRAAGVLAPERENAREAEEEFEPVTVSGRPLSEQIIDERR